MQDLPTLYLEGISLWSPRTPDWQQAKRVIRGECAPHATKSPRPSTTLLPPTERRRIPDTVAIALEVAARACEMSQRDPAELPSVFASTHGDTAISDYMCATLAATPNLISPTKFHNSVHNAAAGYWTIAVRSFAPYTALSAYENTFASGLLEAAMQAVCERSPVLFVAYDIEAVGPLATILNCSGSLGIGMVISTDAPRSGARSMRLRMRGAPADARVQPTPACTPAAELVAGNTLAAAFPFVERLAMDAPGSVTLALGARCALEIEIS
ncbi:MAG: beta-ketoacyl synthase chain length factor [Xanthomonadaceae bacterium]|nr:beta-ketoacyl synthase chain length factor [Xanthomonadaceae bacterium]